MEQEEVVTLLRGQLKDSRQGLRVGSRSNRDNKGCEELKMRDCWHAGSWLHFPGSCQALRASYTQELQH
jgi:hypothetical protein